MELQFFGANCLRIVTKKATLVIDDNLVDLGQKSILKDGDIALFTGTHGPIAKDAKLLIDQPGEYEVSDISIKGIPARANMEDAGQQNATIFQLISDDIRVAVLGHIYPELNDAQLESLGTIDVMFIPVGDNGYTMDPIGALKLIKKVEPKIVIPTHYEDKALKYPVPQQPLEEAIKVLAMEPSETLPKLKIKAGELGDSTRLIVLERQ
ncbi:MAG TPA: MBL fold metallo-hydrolase [Patescibacteria group bacterium]|nr:MBL fold metallo-hydrolase [Patescibacteria group bacterium]